MATTKSKSSTSVQNTQAKLMTGVNQMSESLLQRSFEPLFSSKDGKARLTFCGAQHSLLKWVEKGVAKQKPKLKLVFSVLDITHEAPQNIALEFDYRISPNNLLGKTLILMGYQYSEETVILDEDNEYGIKTKPVSTSELFKFLREQAGLIYKATLSPVTKKNKKTGEEYQSALWNIVPDSIEPMLTKTGEQLRDVPVEDIDEESFVNPKIDMVTEVE